MYNLSHLSLTIIIIISLTIGILIGIIISILGLSVKVHRKVKEIKNVKWDIIKGE